MWLRAVRKASSSVDRRLVDAHHQLRARIFAGRLGWSVDVRDDRETDEYDGFDPTYILALADPATVVGCARLLPATGPTMLERTFPQLLAAGRLTAHAGMVESSRFCVDTGLGEGRGAGALHEATLTMFAGIIEWSIANGYSEIVTATDLRFERILKRAGWPMRRLGEPRQIGNTVAIAGLLPADLLSFERLRPVAYRSVITPAEHLAA
ncbi:acyl-homoserine-lactone synthase [Chelatococcus asaccharovorans]|uniref:acyl-homoserine-lactone synthase n=1 Tax=Chelatococcus asaccharovorans TaxID=28210 RepID=UPI00224C66BB|nr:acyl-homoserine-lactone synthase TraI [Chelatococcus asaccharovorans]CAH1661170.1 putative acyl-homoserine-lactone synthase [Chelatococcus asaccharovorans]CAH1689975.1 putative acyl-homoserine-lactone synthase [Chelatococcus asaccharovorans]